MKNRVTLFIGFIFVSASLLCACGKKNEEETYKYSTKDVSELIQSADKSFADGDYKDSLDYYLDAMVAEPKNVEARIGAAKCQMELENYNVAYDDLCAAIQIDTGNVDVYNLLIELSEEADNMNYAVNAVNLAKQYEVEEFMEKVPAAPSISEESGKYDCRLDVEITNNAGSGELFYSVDNGSRFNISNALYRNAIPIITGDSVLSTYVVVDGIPSETVTREYVCEYQGVPVTFKDPCIETIVRQTLDIQEGPITDVDCEGITVLDSDELRVGDIDWDEYKNEINITSLEDLKYFPCLQTIQLDYQEKITDYTPVINCPLLGGLYIRYADLEDISFAANISELRYLYIDNNDIKDISCLYGLKKLNALGVKNNSNLNIDGIDNLKKIRILEIDDDQISDYSVLKELESLEDLVLCGQGGIDLTPIGEIEGLTDFSYQFDRNAYNYNDMNYFSDVSPLTKLKKLEYLSIDCMGDFSNLECLSELPNLNKLYLYDTDYYEYGSEEKKKAVEKLLSLMPGCTIKY